MIATFDNLIEKDGEPVTIENDLNDEEMLPVIQFAKESGAKSTERLKKALSWTPEN